MVEPAGEPGQLCFPRRQETRRGSAGPAIGQTETSHRPLVAAPAGPRRSPPTRPHTAGSLVILPANRYPLLKALVGELDPLHAAEVVLALVLQDHRVPIRPKLLRDRLVDDHVLLPPALRLVAEHDLPHRRVVG